MTDETRAVDHLALNKARLSGEGLTDLAIRLLKERDEARGVARDVLEQGVCLASLQAMDAPGWINRYPWLRETP